MRLMLLVFFVCVVVGCSSPNKGTADKQEGTKQPKHPDLFMTMKSAGGHSGAYFWNKLDNGYKPNVHIRDRILEDGTKIVCKSAYTSSTAGGDSYTLEVSLGDKKETKEVLYEGKRLEVDVTDKATFILEPKERKR